MDPNADPKPVVEEKCATGHCASYKKQLEACTARVQANPSAGETCTQELFDFAHCVDHCAAPKIFANLR